MSDYQEEPDYEYIDYPEDEQEIEEPMSQLPALNRRVNYLNLSEFSQKSVVFVTIEDIKTLISQKCEDLKELTGLDKDEALIVFHYFQWRKDLLESSWFEQEDNIRLKAGLRPVKAAQKPTSQKYTCPMCFETYNMNHFDSLSCNHLLCHSCLEDYINYNITKLEKGFFWKCPTEGCNLIIPDSFNQRYMRSELINQYYKKMGITYADNSKSLRWCPGTDCQYGCEVESILARTITCKCGWVYCFKCGIEDHQPCDCEKTKEWLKKDESGGANAKWLLINTKDCPKCKKAIEKNQGCNFMKCRHPGCQFEFCWLCLADWKTHNDHFKCNKYDNLSKEEKKKMDDDVNKERTDLQKYAFYYERYFNNEVAIRSIAKLIKQIQSEEKEIAIELGLSLTQLEFLLNSCYTLRNSKRILKWSYAYGFYLENDLQRNLYEIIQQNLDLYSGELHVLLEKEYEKVKKDISEFTNFKSAVLSAVFKCQTVQVNSEIFIHQMEEFEINQLEQQMASNPPLKKNESNSSEKSKDGKKEKSFLGKLMR